MFAVLNKRKQNRYSIKNKSSVQIKSNKFIQFKSKPNENYSNQSDLSNLCENKRMNKQLTKGEINTKSACLFFLCCFYQLPIWKFCFVRGVLRYFYTWITLPASYFLLLFSFRLFCVFVLFLLPHINQFIRLCVDKVNRCGQSVWFLCGDRTNRTVWCRLPPPAGFESHWILKS